VNERELAKILGISYQGVVKALKGGPTGESAMTAENNPKVARVLGVDPDWLATGEGAPTAEPPLRLTPTERAIVLAYRQAQRMPPTAGELPSHREPLARMKTIHDRIRELRQAKGWSLQRLAEEVTRLEGKKAPLVWQTVQQWEKSTRPKHERLAVVAQALGTTVPALMGC
jgi:transcriptional regulator with XRE-family HTH domain